MEKKDLRIVFLGTPDFAVESLSRLVDNGYNIVGVVTMPDKPAGRGHKMYQSPVKEYALAHGLKLLQPVKLKDETFVEELRSLEADLFIVIAFRMLPEVVWRMPRLGTFNLHASLLPRYRGAAPINWAVINGDTETGVTTFFLKHEIDTGDIIARQRIEIAPDENVGSVHDRLMMLGADLTLQTVESILDGTLTTIPQDELLKGEEPTPAPKIFKDTCRIDWTAGAVKVANLVRGLSPYPGAWSPLEADGTPVGEMKIFAGKVADVSDLAPGEVRIADGTMTVGCGDSTAYSVTELQIPGKRKMPVADFLRGNRLADMKLG
ncbi:MAG: methionyl-tRNA formyltransferase [Bacteroides sp.]|nr:methionyl-tRNA formyltransferase [Bacteroides sp.]MBD5368729.1 methionyl-tRNA formyltransferase [Bacteroides sp.]MDE5829263.1 methionyl-tRNA formyltransferase [Duncaniella sp.]